MSSLNQGPLQLTVTGSVQGPLSPAGPRSHGAHAPHCPLPNSWRPSRGPGDVPLQAERAGQGPFQGCPSRLHCLGTSASSFPLLIFGLNRSGVESRLATAEHSRRIHPHLQPGLGTALRNVPRSQLTAPLKLLSPLPQSLGQAGDLLYLTECGQVRSEQFWTPLLPLCPASSDPKPEPASGGPGSPQSSAPLPGPLALHRRWPWRRLLVCAARYRGAAMQQVARTTLGGI